MKSLDRSSRAFALVIVLSLLAVLVVIVFAISLVGKVDSQLGQTAVYQIQARQNALMAMKLAIGEVQRYAGPDERVTGMAGITGVPAGAGNYARHWCGVWDRDGNFLRWLASGGGGGTIPALGGTDAIPLVSTKSIGAQATDREQVRVLLRPINTINASGQTVTLGQYAYWVGDAGIKLRIVIPDADGVVSGQKHAINQQFGIQPDDSALDNVLSYGQLNIAGATTPQRQGGFHSYTHSHYGLIGSTLKAGVVNVNSTSNRFWTGIGATYNRWHPGGFDDIGTFASGMSAAATWSTPAGDKMANGPFLTKTAFVSGNTAVINAITGGGGTLAEFDLSMQDWLAVRSDTFRIRVYGDAMNPADNNVAGSTAVAVAYCEAIVQRTPEIIDSVSGPLGRRFVITYFRWLGPDDI